MFFADFYNLLVELVELVDCTPYVESKAAESARPPNLITSCICLFLPFFGHRRKPLKCWVDGEDRRMVL
jgi:hypothetical protein